MQNLNLSVDELQIIKKVLEKDAEDIAADISFFEASEPYSKPKEYIDVRISLCNKFDLNFWNHIQNNCPDFHFKQLKAIFEGQNMDKFIETYEIPSENEEARSFLKMINESRTRLNNK